MNCKNELIYKRESEINPIVCKFYNFKYLYVKINDISFKIYDLHKCQSENTITQNDILVMAEGPAEAKIYSKN